MVLNFLKKYNPRSAAPMSRYMAKKMFKDGWTEYNTAGAKAYLQSQSAPSRNVTNSSKSYAYTPFKKSRKPYVKGTLYKKHTSGLNAGGGAISTTSFVAKRRPTKQVKAMERVGAPNLLVTNVGKLITTLFGYQGINSLPHIDVSLLKALSTTFTVTKGTKRYVIESYISEIMYTNLTNASAELDIYDIVCRKDLPYSQTLVSGGSTSTSYPVQNFPDQYYIQGVQAINNAASAGFGGSDNANFLGSIPMDSPFFKDYFKIIRKRRCTLPQGASTRHWVDLKPNKMVDDTIYNSSIIGNVSGLSMFTMTILRGAGCSDIIDGTATSAEIKLAVTQSTRAKFTWVSDASYSGYYNDNMYSPTGAQLINVGDGSVQPVGEA